MFFQFPIHLEIFPDNNLVYRLDIKNKPPKEELILKNKNHYLTIDSPFHLTIYNASQCLLKIDKKIIPIKKYFLKNGIGKDLKVIYNKYFHSIKN